MRKKFLSILLITCMVITLFPTAAIPVSAVSYNQTYTGTIPVSTTLYSGTYLLDGCTFSTVYQAVIINGSVTLVIKGDVSITSGTGYAGIQVLSGNTVTIRGYEDTTNSLTVHGGNAGNGGNGADGQAGSSSGGGIGGVGGYGGAGAGAAIGSNGGRGTNISGYNLCYVGAAIGTVNIDSSNLSLSLQGGSGGSGSAGGGGGNTSDSGKSGGGGGGGGGGGFPAPAIGQGGANGMFGGDGGAGTKTSGTWGAVGGGGGGAGGYGYTNGGGGNGGRGACYKSSGIYKAQSGYYANTVAAGTAGLPYSKSESSLRAYLDSSNYAYPGQGGSATVNGGVIYGGEGGDSAEKAGGNGVSIYPNTVTSASYKIICFNINGGSENSYYMTTGSTVGTIPADPSRSGYTFKGWNTKSDGTGYTVTASTSLSGTVNTYYAVWERDTFSAEVTVHKNTYANQWSGVAGDAVVLSTSYQNAQENKLTATPANGKFTFTGIDIDAVLYVWAKNSAGVYVRQDGYISSEYGHQLADIFYYDLTLTAGTGIQSTSGAGTYLSGETATISAVLASGYAWNSWSDGNTTMTGRTITANAKIDLTANASLVPTYTVSVNQTAIDFGSLSTGYAQPSAVTVTITNTGNQSVTLTQPTATDYIIGTLSKTDLTSGESVAFTVRPKADLPYGNYDETITVSTNHSTSAAVSAKFKVIDSTPPTAEISIGANKWSSFLNSVTFGLFFKETKTVTVTANDTESGVAKVEYLLSDTKFENQASVAGTWNDITAARQFSMSPNTKKFLYARITDNDGNVTVINTDGVVLYTDSSSTAAGITFTKTGTANQSTQVTLNGNTVKEIKNGDDVIPESSYTVVSDGTITFKASYLDSLAAGDYTLTVSYNPLGEAYSEKDGNAAPAATVITLTVQKADNSVTNISNIGKTYDGNAVAAPTYGKLGTGTGTVEYKEAGADDSTYSTAAPQNAGVYTVRVTVAADESYKQASATADFAITQKQVTISGAAVEATKEYDGNTDAVITNKGVLSANYDGENLAIKTGNATYSDKNVASDKTVTFYGFTLDGSAKDNYTLTAQPENTTANITAKGLTVTVSVNDKQYDGTDTATFKTTPALDGIVSGDIVQLTNGVPTFSGISVANAIPIHFTAFSITGTDSANYTLKQPTGITANIYNHYDAAQGSDYEVNSNDWLNDTFSITAKSGYELSKTNTVAGAWTSTFSASDETADGQIQFYVRNTTTGAISTLTTESYRIDKTAPAATISLGTNNWNRFFNTITFGLFFKETKRVTITPDDAASGITSVEYLLSDTAFEDTSDITGTWISLSADGGGFNILPNSKQFIYVRVIDNAGNQAIVNSEGIVIYTDSRGSTETITFTKTTGADVVANVILNGNTVKEIKNGSAGVPTSGYTVNAGAISFKASYLDSLAAGTYTLTVFYNPMGEAYSEKDGNAAPAATVITLTVQKADNSVTNISNIGKTYDGDAVSSPAYQTLSTGAATFEYKAASADDNTYSDVAPKNAGEYTVRVAVLADDNYKQASSTANFTITQKQVTINGTAVEAAKEYDGTTDAEITNNGALSANYDGSNLKITVGTASYNNKNVADGKPVTFSGFELTGSAKDNYTLVSQPEATTAHITAKELTIHLSVKDKLFNDKNDAEFDGTPSLVGIVNGDTVFLVNGTPTFASNAVGDDIAINFTAFSINGADATNYTLTQPTGITASIKPYFAEKDSQYSVNSNDWMNTDFTVTALPGFKVSKTNAADGSWVNTLSTSDETGDGKSNFYVLEVASGVISEKVTETYKIDKTVPTGTISVGSNRWNTFLNTITFGLFFNATQTVSIDAADTLSGIANVEYAASSAALSLDEVKMLSWTDGTSINVTIEDQKQFIYYAKITDNAGNVTYLSTDGAEYDTTAPAITGVTDGGIYYTTQLATATDKNLGSVTLNAADTASPVRLAGNTAATYTVIATDQAGNATTYVVTMKPIASLSDSIDSLTLDNVKSSDKTAIEAVEANVGAVDTTNATDEEKTALNAIADRCNALLGKISDTADEIKRITDTVNGYDLETVKSSDKAALEQLIEDIDTLVSTQNLTVDEAAALGTVKATANALLAKISDITAEIKRITDAVNGYDLATVKSSDKIALEQLVEDINTLLATSNLTEEEITALNGIKTKAENLLAKISGTAALIKQLTDTVDGYILDEVKSTDQASIEQVIADIDAFIATENLTEDEQAALDAVKTKAQALLDRIADAAKASAKKEIKDAENINKDNVKSSDKDILTNAKEALEAAIRDYEGNYTETELTDLKDRLATVIAALEAIDNAEKVINSIILLPEPAQVKADDKDAIYAAKAAYDALTDSEKAIVGADYAEKLNAALEALANLDKGASPQTGDQRHTFLWIALLFVSSGAVTVLGVKGRKRKAVK